CGAPSPDLQQGGLAAGRGAARPPCCGHRATKSGAVRPNGAGGTAGLRSISPCAAPSDRPPPPSAVRPGTRSSPPVGSSGSGCGRPPCTPGAATAGRCRRACATTGQWWRPSCAARTHTRLPARARRSAPSQAR
ncbi:MAG: hypothetical protein AVDCRST_MAG66-373, partial [uncultured Pseudonocardia sp.]